MNTEGLRGELYLDEPLARHTSWRVGGPARRLYRPADAADLAVFLRRLDPEEPLLWVGLGSNLLVADAGFPGTVVETQGCLKNLGAVGDLEVRAEAGVSCAKVSRFAARRGLIGVEFLAGIPGTMGGALAMNAGAWGSETWTPVALVRTIDRRGEVRERPPEDFRVGYRQVGAPAGEWFLDVEISLSQGDIEAAAARIRELLDRRTQTQPTSLPTCGSVFRNPPGGFAARLIVAAGLKGFTIGGAQVSETHANFIINTGSASAADIAQVIDHVRERVEATSGVCLVTEVRQVGGEAT